MNRLTRSCFSSSNFRTKVFFPGIRPTGRHVNLAFLNFLLSVNVVNNISKARIYEVETTLATLQCGEITCGIFEKHGNSL